MDKTNLLFVAAVLVIVAVSQFTARPVRPIAYLFAALLVARGFAPAGPAKASVSGVALLVVGLLGSMLFGYLRGRVMPLWRNSDGRLMRRGNGTIALLWLATIAVRLLIGAAGEALLHQPFNLDALWLGLGLTLAVQHAVLTYRGRAVATPAASAPAQLAG